MISIYKYIYSFWLYEKKELLIFEVERNQNVEMDQLFHIVATRVYYYTSVYVWAYVMSDVIQLKIFSKWGRLL